MRTKQQILEDLEILEASMEWSDDPHYKVIHGVLVDEYAATHSKEINDMYLDDVCALESHIQNWINPDFVVDFEKIRGIVKELQVSSLPF